MRQSVFRRKSVLRVPIGAVLCTCACVSVQAARPLVTDDARILDPQTCQLESGYRHDHVGHEWTALPACNPTGLFDMTVGLAHVYSQGGTTQRLMLQAKTMLRPALANDWGIGFTLGALDQLTPGGSSRFGETYVNVPVTFSWRDDQVLLHVNAGVNRNRYQDGTHLTWGTATEVAVMSRLSVLAETFGIDQGRPFWQTAVRFTLVQDRVQMDGALGGQWRGGSGTRWWGIGLRLATSKLW